MNAQVNEPRQEAVRIDAAGIAEMVGGRLTERPQEGTILAYLPPEEVAIARHAVAMGVQLQIDALLDQLI